MEKTVILASDSLANSRRIADALSGLDIGLAAVPIGSLREAAAEHPECDLAIAEPKGQPQAMLAEVQPALVQSGCKALLIVVAEDQLGSLRLPMNLPSDFVMADASAEEVRTRAGMLL